MSDLSAKAKVLDWMANVQLGNLGDVRSVGGKVFERRIHSGPGYRIYFMQSRFKVVFLLMGGDKSTQKSDIAKARALAASVIDKDHFHG